MIRTRREIWLAGGLAVAGVLGLGWDHPSLRAWWPNAAQRTQRDRLRQEAARLQTHWVEIERAQAELADWDARSLPPDPAVAATLLQSHLLEAGRTTGLTQLGVVPATPLEEAGGVQRLRVHVQAKGLPPQLARFLDACTRSPLLQRIHQLTLTPTTPDGAPGPLQLDLTLEALSLPTAAPRHTLLSEDAPAPATPPTPGFAPLLAARSFFARTTATPPESTPAPRAPNAAPRDPRTQIRLVAVWRTDQRLEAWLLDAESRERIVLPLGEVVQVGPWTTRLLAADARQIVLALDDAPYAIRIGQTLSEAAPRQQP